MSGFSENLRNLRKVKGMTQSELAEKLFTAPQTVSRWENGDGEPSLDLLAILCDVLGTSADRLLNRDLPKLELLDIMAEDIAGMSLETAADEGFLLAFQFVRGLHKRYFGDECTLRPTYSSLHAGQLRGFYADREDTPRMFVLYDSGREWVDHGNLHGIFGALADEMTVKAVKKLYGFPSDRMYDRESLIAALDLTEEVFDKTVESLIFLGQLKKNTVSFNGQETALYSKSGRPNLMLLLAMADLLYGCGTDGNL